MSGRTNVLHQTPTQNKAGGDTATAAPSASGNNNEATAPLLKKKSSLANATSSKEVPQSSTSSNGSPATMSNLAAAATALSSGAATKRKRKDKRIILHLSACKYPVLRRVAKACEMNTIEEDDDLEFTNFNILWADTVIPLDRLQEFQPWQHFNHFPSMYNITRKINLSITMGKMQKGLPEYFCYVPRSWSLKTEKQSFQKYFSGLTYANGAIVHHNNNNVNGTHASAPSEGNGGSGEGTVTSSSAITGGTTDQKDALVYGHKTVGARQVFIMKPNAGCQGKGIILTRDPLGEVDNPEDYVVQEYISRPLLIDGRKFDLRVYCLVTSMKYPSILVFNDGLVRLCAESYEKPNAANMANACKHLTNYAVNKKSAAYQLASAEGEDGSKRDFVWFNRWLDESLTDEMLVTMYSGNKSTAAAATTSAVHPSSPNTEGETIDEEESSQRSTPSPLPLAGATAAASTSGDAKTNGTPSSNSNSNKKPPQHTRSAQLWSAIDHIIVKTILSAQPKVRHSYNMLYPHSNDGYTCFEVLGFDILIDHKLEPWLMEVNHTPSFATDSPLDRRVKEALITEVFRVINPSVKDKQRSLERAKMQALQRINGTSSTAPATTATDFSSGVGGSGKGEGGGNGAPSISSTTTNSNNNGNTNQQVTSTTVAGVPTAFPPYNGAEPYNVYHERSEDSRLINFRRVYPVPPHHLQKEAIKLKIEQMATNNSHLHSHEGSHTAAIQRQTTATATTTTATSKKAIQADNLIPATQPISDINERIALLATPEEVALRTIIYDEVLQYALSSSQTPTTASQEQRQNEIRQQRMKREAEAQILAMKIPGNNKNGGGGPQQQAQQQLPKGAAANTGRNNGRSMSQQPPQRNGVHNGVNYGMGEDVRNTTPTPLGNTNGAPAQRSQSSSHLIQGGPPQCGNNNNRNCGSVSSIAPSGTTGKQPTPPPPRNVAHHPNNSSSSSELIAVSSPPEGHVGGSSVDATASAYANNVNSSTSTCRGGNVSAAAATNQAAAKEKALADRKRRQQERLEEQMARHRRRMELGPRVSVFQLREASAYVNEGILPGMAPTAAASPIGNTDGGYSYIESDGPAASAGASTTGLPPTALQQGYNYASGYHYGGNVGVGNPTTQNSAQIVSNNNKNILSGPNHLGGSGSERIILGGNGPVFVAQQPTINTCNNGIAPSGSMRLVVSGGSILVGNTKVNGIKQQQQQPIQTPLIGDASSISSFSSQQQQRAAGNGNSVEIIKSVPQVIAHAASQHPHSSQTISVPTISHRSGSVLVSNGGPTEMSIRSETDSFDNAISDIGTEEKGFHHLTHAPASEVQRFAENTSYFNDTEEDLLLEDETDEDEDDLNYVDNGDDDGDERYRYNKDYFSPSKYREKGGEANTGPSESGRPNAKENLMIDGGNNSTRQSDGNTHYEDIGGEDEEERYYTYTMMDGGVRGGATTDEKRHVLRRFYALRRAMECAE